MNRIVKEQEIERIAKNAKNGQFESLTYFGEHDMSKGGRTHDNTLWGRVTKLVRVTNIQFGVDYSNKVNALNGTTDFVADAPKGASWVVYPRIILSQKTGYKQLRCTLCENTKFETTYFVDGRKATASELAIIKQYTPVRDKLIVFNITIDKIVEWHINGHDFVDNDIIKKIAV